MQKCVLKRPFCRNLEAILIVRAPVIFLPKTCNVLPNLHFLNPRSLWGDYFLPFSTPLNMCGVSLSAPAVPSTKFPARCSALDILTKYTPRCSLLAVANTSCPSTIHCNCRPPAKPRGRREKALTDNNYLTD